jgi:hypothetical protein
VPTRFNANLTTVSLLAKYNFLRPDFFMRPYLAVGVGALFQNGIGDSYVSRRKVDVAVPEFGAGVNFHFGKYLGFQIQELLMYTSADDIDLVRGGMNDMYLMHTIGITCNLGKLGKLGGPEQTGVGDRIDKCPKIKQHRNRVTKSEGNALRKEKKSKRKSLKSAKKAKRKTSK